MGGRERGGMGKGMEGKGGRDRTGEKGRDWRAGR